MLNRRDAARLGVREGEIALVGIGEVELYVNVMETDTEIAEGEIGFLKKFGKSIKCLMDTPFL